MIVSTLKVSEALNIDEIFILFSLIGALVIPILEVILICLPPPIPMLDFMLGPSYASVIEDTEESNPTENVTK